MALRSKRPCRKSGCPALVESGYCDTHKGLTATADRFRGTAAERGYDYDWRKTRTLALKRDKYLCQHCLAAGLLTLANEVDHITPLAKQGARLDVTNLQSLCSSCHRKKTVQDLTL